MGFIVYYFVSVVLCPLTGHHWQESGSVLFTRSHQLFIHVKPSLVASKEFQLLGCPCSCMLVLFLYWEAQNLIPHSGCNIIDDEERGKITSSLLTCSWLSRESRMLLSAFAVKAWWWIRGKFFVHQDPGAFSAKLLSSWSFHNLYWCIGLFLPRCKNLWFSQIPGKILLKALFNRGNGTSQRIARNILVSFNCCPLSLSIMNPFKYWNSLSYQFLFVAPVLKCIYYLWNVAHMIYVIKLNHSSNCHCFFFFSKGILTFLKKLFFHKSIM